MPKTGQSRGFTLIEMCAVILIGGLIMASAAEGYRVYLQKKKFEDVNRKLTTIETAINTFHGLATQKRYPCPANPTLDIMSDAAGREVSCGTLSALPLGTCTNEKGPGTGICRVKGRDLDLGGGVMMDLTFLVGAVPFKTLKEEQDTMLDGAGNKVAQMRRDILSGDDFFENTSSFSREDAIGRDDAVDPWGRQFVYVVSEQLTTALNYGRIDYGAIPVETESGISLVRYKQDGAFIEGGAYYLILSAGENGLGAYSVTGNKQPCPAGTLDAENCNKGWSPTAPGAWDAKFVAGLRNMGGGASYFDDTTRFWTASRMTLWEHVRDPVTGEILPDIYNTNPGNVGIGAGGWRDDDGDPGTTDPVWTVPEDRLEIRNAGAAGGLRLHDAGNIKVPEVCSRTTAADTTCIPPSVLGKDGPGIKCGPASSPDKIRVMTGIARNSVENDPSAWTSWGYTDPPVQCIEVDKVSSVINSACDPGSLMVGIDGYGKIVCKVPPAP